MLTIKTEAPVYQEHISTNLTAHCYSPLLGSQGRFCWSGLHTSARGEKVGKGPLAGCALSRRARAKGQQAQEASMAPKHAGNLQPKSKCRDGSIQLCAPMPVTQDVHVDARNRTSAISPESGAEGFQVMRGSSLRISGLSAMSADGASPNMRRNWLEK